MKKEPVQHIMLLRKAKNFIKRASPEPLRKILQTYREKQISRTAPTITKPMIIKDLIQLGLGKGDVVFLHSSLRRIGYVEGGAATIIDAIIEVLGSSGTIIVPTFSLNKSIYKTCMDKTYIFDPLTTGTTIGIIPSTFLKYPDIYRSIHPTHSVSAIGKDAEYITEAHHLAPSIFGLDSPWDRLMKLDGKIFALGLKMGSNTFSHAFEDRMADKFPLTVRMKESYFLKCRTRDGEIIEVPVTPFDPKLIKLRMDQENRGDLREYFWQDFNRAGILKVGKIGQATSWLASANEYYDHLAALMKDGITIYSTSQELKRRPLH
jgi:aminoglycoside 3-N-acetyltransferase